MKLTHLGLGALAVALAAGAPTLASAQQYGAYGFGGDRATTGTIAAINGTNITLRDGRQIFLKNGTVIEPTGQRLQVGQQISVRGNPGGNGAINATDVNVGYGRERNGYDRNGYGRDGYDRNGSGGDGYDRDRDDRDGNDRDERYRRHHRHHDRDDRDANGYGADGDRGDGSGYGYDNNGNVR